MSQLVGEWVYGDSGKKLRFSVEENGAALDVTGATSIALNMVKLGGNGDTTDTVSGTIYGVATNGTFEFASIGTEVVSPTSRMQPDVYECRVSFVLSAKTYWTDAFRVAVVKFP